MLPIWVSSCHYTKYVPEGEQLLTQNEIYINEKKSRNQEVTGIVKQQPNKILLFRSVKPYLTLYGWGNPEKDGISGWFTDIGEAPVVLDSALTHKSAYQISQYLFSNGYFLNTYRWEVDTLKNEKKAKVKYYYTTGSQYRIKTFNVYAETEALEILYNQHKKDSKVLEGNPYSAQKITEERERVSKLFRNSGYFGFPREVIRFEVDTSLGDHQIALTMYISDLPVTTGDTTYTIPHKPYKINSVQITPAYSFKDEVQRFEDTVTHNTYIIYETDSTQFTPSLLTRSIHFKQGDYYNEQEVKQTYEHINSLKVFKTAEISFKPSVVDTSKSNELDVYVKLAPGKKRSFTTELEFTNTSGNFGISTGLGWLNRNFFGGGESLELSVRGGIEAQVSFIDESQLFNTWELGGEVAVNFPRFIFPWVDENSFPKRMLPRSRVFLSASRTNRQEFDRLVYTLGLQYLWKESETKNHSINLTDLSYVKINRIDPDYLARLEFKNGFQDNFIMATRYAFTYNNQHHKFRKHADYFRGTAEISGNILALANSISPFPYDSTQYAYTVFGVPYSQYFKIDLDYRHYTRITSEHIVATRFFVGYSQSYGNSLISAPFEKMYFAGGSNDIRSWLAYKLGPGLNPNADEVVAAPFKLLASIEYRFPILKNLKGALFADAGNVWYMPWVESDLRETGQSEDDIDLFVENFTFKSGTVFKGSALGGGMGLRYDFNFFIFRLDMGLKLHNPQNYLQPGKSPWIYVPGLKWSDVVFNLALGYPF
ncbi:MAG: BamA/TamA family outer membrane protein [Schleiferiaceae bacterium]